MERREDYIARLYDYLNSVRGAPFRYGANDCALFTAGAVAAMTDEDPAAAFRGRYKTLIGGLRKIREAGYADQVDFVARNFAEIPPREARAGDLILTDEGALGVCVGDRLALAGETGLRFAPLSSIERAFR